MAHLFNTNQQDINIESETDSIMPAIQIGVAITLVLSMITF